MVITMDDQNRRDSAEQNAETETLEESNENIASEEAKQSQNDLEKEFEALKNLSQQLENNYKRALADYQNLQRRTQEEKSEWIRMATKDFILKILPVLDTLRLTQKHIQDQGLELTIGQFDKVLQEEGIVQIPTLGKSFDPKTMEAVTTKEADKKEKGIVVEEVRAGYIFGEYVLRAAQVIVGA